MARVPLQPYLRVPVPKPEGINADVLFYLQRTPDGRCFYECTSASCTGSFCPSFSVVKDSTMPSWVITCLRDHVRSYHTKEPVYICDGLG